MHGCLNWLERPVVRHRQPHALQLTAFELRPLDLARHIELAPLEIERQITFPVEVALSGLPDIEEIRSVSKFGLSAVTVVFHDSVDTYFARQLVLERLAQAREQIPESIGSPEMGPISTGLGEIYQYELKASDKTKHDATALRTIQDWIVKRQLLGVSGVVEVSSFGGKLKQYEIVRAVVKGTKEGKNVTHIVDCHTAGMPAWEIGLDIDTGSPPSIAAQMLVCGQITERGVVPPEVAV